MTSNDLYPHIGKDLGINTYTEPSIITIVDRLFEQFPDVDKKSIDYVEAYAPGNSVLDGIEARSIGKVSNGRGFRAI